MTKTKRKPLKLEPSFNVNRTDAELIHRIVDRAIGVAETAQIRYSRMDWEMDFAACHANGCPLQLKELLAADAADFAHDVFGIRHHLDRETGKLGDCFRPRFAAKERKRKRK